MIMRSAPVYTSSVGLLDEVRERGRTGPDRVWDLFHALAIRVHARVEIADEEHAGSYYFDLAIRVHARVEIQIASSMAEASSLQSVYMRELKFNKDKRTCVMVALQSVYMRELKSAAWLS